MGSKKIIDDEQVYYPLPFEFERVNKLESKAPEIASTISSVPRKKNRQAAYYCKDVTQQTSLSPLAQKTNPVDAFYKEKRNNPSLCESFTLIVEIQEEIEKQLLEIIDISAQSSQKNIAKSKQSFKEVENKLAKSKKNSSLFTNLGNIGSLAGSITSIIIGISLLATTAINPLSLLASMALVFSGLSSISAFILRKAKAPTAVSLGIEIAGGALGLLSGGISLGVKIIPSIQAGMALTKAFSPALSLATKVGVGLLKTSALTTKGISTLYKKEGSLKSAALKELDGEIGVFQQDLTTATKLMKDLSSVYLQNTIDLIEALEKEKKIVEIYVNNQNLRG